LNASKQYPIFNEKASDLTIHEHIVSLSIHCSWILQSTIGHLIKQHLVSK